MNVFKLLEKSKAWYLAAHDQSQASAEVGADLIGRALQLIFGRLPRFSASTGPDVPILIRK